MAELVESVQYKLTVDKSGAAAAQKMIDAVRNRQVALNESFDKLGAVAKAGVTNVRTAFASIKAGIDDEIKKAAEARKAHEKLGKSRKEAADEARKAQERYTESMRDEIEAASALRAKGLEAGRQGVGDLSTTASAAASVLGSNSALGNAAGTVSDLTGLIEYLPTVGAALASLNPALLGMAAGVAVVAGVITLVNQETDKAKASAERYAESLKREVDAREASRSAILTGDPAGVQARIQEIQAQVGNITKNQIQPLQQQNADIFATAMEETFKELQVGNLGGRSDADLRQTAALNVASNTQNLPPAFNINVEQIKAASAELAPLVAELEQLQANGIEGARVLQQINQTVTFGQLKDELLQSGTGEEVQERLRAAMRDAALYAEQIDQTEAEIAQARADGNDELVNALNIQQQTNIGNRDYANGLRDVYVSLLPAVELNERARNKETEALKVQSEMLEKNERAERSRTEALEASAAAAETNLARDIGTTGRSVADSAEDIKKAQESLAKAQEESAARSTAIREKLIADERRILQSANDNATELAEDFGVDRIHAEEDLAIALKAIQRDFRTDSLNAQGERDALAALQAEDKRRKDTRSEKEQYTVEERRRKEAYQRALIDLAVKTQRELQIARDGATNALRLEQEKANAEINLRQAALNAAVVQYNHFLGQLQALFQQAIANISSDGQYREVIIPTSQTLTREEGRALGIPGFAKGGRFGAGTTAIVGEKGREIVHFDRAGRVSNNRETEAILRGQPGNVTISIPISGVGLNKRQVIATVDQRLDETLTEAGME